MVGNRRKVIVAYRTLPNDPEHCLVVQTENLDADMHDTIIRLVESPSGQEAYEFAEAMMRSRIPDGRILLAALHTTGKLTKLKTSDVEMTPNTATAIRLDELNITIAESRGVGIEDLAVKPQESRQMTPDTPAQEPVAEVPVEAGPLDDETLAAQLRSQADAMFKEAKRLREQAEELVPTKKSNKKIAESV